MRRLGATCGTSQSKTRNAHAIRMATLYTEAMARKASVVIEKGEHGFYAWCPELKGCQSQGDTLEEAVANIREAIELYLETLPADERNVILSREIFTTAIEVNA
jgi:predicted RNase H-like HicB family nuclease